MIDPSQNDVSDDANNGQAFHITVRPRYLEVDQQGIVSNVWYLAWLDDAFVGWLEYCGAPLAGLLANGWDTQLVHLELDWFSGLRYNEEAKIEVSLLSQGRSSFTVSFHLSCGQRVIAKAKVTHVVVSSSDYKKRDIPAYLASALKQAKSQHLNA